MSGKMQSKEYRLDDIPCTLKTLGHFLAQRKPKPVLHYALQKSFQSDNHHTTYNIDLERHFSSQ